MKFITRLDIRREGPPAFIVVGRNGAGKSTLINSLFGKDVAEVGESSDVTKGVVKYTLPKTGVEIYDTPGAGGLDEDAENAMRLFLKINVPKEDDKKIPADVIIYLFTHERLTSHEFKLFKEINDLYGDRTLVVKNYNPKDSKKSFNDNLRQIQERTGRKPLCIDALNGTEIDNLVREIFRYLEPEKLKRFNMSLEDNRRKAREMSKVYTLKLASRVAVIRGEKQDNIKKEIERHKEALSKIIMEAYLNEVAEEDLSRKARNHPSSVVLENNSNAEGVGGATGAGLGMLIGLLGGPVGVALGGIIGFLFGISSIPKVTRGGSPAVVNVIAQGYGLSEIIEESFKEPSMLLAQSQRQMTKWLEKNKRKIEGTLTEATLLAEYGIKDAALVEYLNHPNTLDPAKIECELEPIVTRVFQRK